MLVILKHELRELTLETDNDNADEVSELKINFTETSDDDEGNAFLLEIIKDELVRELSEQYGHYGHIITPDSVTNLDLLSALPQLKKFKIVGELPELDFEPLPDDVES
jgi:hypothetical protein